MRPSNPSFKSFETSLTGQSVTEWDLMECDKASLPFKRHSIKSVEKDSSQHEYAPDWANVVPRLILKLASEISEKKKLEIRFNLLEILANEFQVRLHKLESAKTKIVPVNTFAPEPYELLKTFLVSVQSVEGGFEAGWYDANIHSSGENEEEAVSNLKSLILDFYDSLSKDPAEKLGTESKRQLDVIKTFIKRTH